MKGHAVFRKIDKSGDCSEIITDAKYGDSGWWCHITIPLTQYFLIKD
jgi:hypothetical protein